MQDSAPKEIWLTSKAGSQLRDSAGLVSTTTPDFPLAGRHDMELFNRQQYTRNGNAGQLTQKRSVRF